MSDLVVQHADFIHSVINARSQSPVMVDRRITQSWRRCIEDHGLDPARQPEIEVLNGQALHERQQQLADVLKVAKLEMTNLHQQLAGSGHAVLLTDIDGVVLHFEGEADFSSTAHATGMRLGAVWSESRQGTNAMGTCLFERQPLVIHHTEHFFARNILLTCSAAPIFDPQGRLKAVLDASSQSELAQQHTLVLVNMAAQSIENRLLLNAHARQWILRFHSRAEFVGALGEGLLAFDEAGQLLAANRSALFQLGFEDLRSVANASIEQLFNVPLAFLHDPKSQSWIAPPTIFEARHGSRFFAVVQAPKRSEPRLQPPPRAQKVTILNAAGTDPRRVRLEDLLTGDPVMARIVRSAQRIRGRDIPVMITGETGSGKEVLARAIHNSSLGAERPFIAVNCASLPETLIESELFGYRGGAFTGASREGRRGKILQADGGTLFLDEIGDMPLQLQARLLRVLEEREVVPLGSETAVSVNVRLLCATHRDLQAMVQEGAFREDLYYRLQGITLSLPPLRNRADKRALIQRMLEQEAGEDTLVTIDQAALDRLVQHPWPGNLRQLRNVLRTMLALRESDELTVDDLPAGTGFAPPAEMAAAPAAAPEPNLHPLAKAEREALLQVLQKCYWNISRAATELDISRNTLYRKMKQLNISDPSRTGRTPGAAID